MKDSKALSWVAQPIVFQLINVYLLIRKTPKKGQKPQNRGSILLSKDEITKLILAILTESSSVFQIPLKNLEDLFIHETHESFVRMDSALREMVEENNMLKMKLMRSESNTHNESAIRDRDHIIQKVEARNA